MTFFNIHDEIRCECLDDNVRFEFEGISTGWMSQDDSFIERIQTSNLNQYFIKEHILKEIEIKNLLDEGIIFLKSEKFAKAIAAAGIAALCGANETVVAIVAGAAMTVLPALVYCITEGRIDAASVLAAKQAVGDAADALGASDATQSIIDAAGDMLAAMGEDDTE